MLRASRQGIALFVLAVAVSPWFSPAMVALHMGRHAAGHGGHDRGSGLAAVLHGHHHERGTPGHHHLLTPPGGTALPARATLAPVPVVLGEIPPEAAAAAARLATGAACVGHDPPSAQRSFHILRI